MEVVCERCCGLDVHKKRVTACVITPEGREIRTFGTMTDDLLALVDWIKEKGCLQVAMESTGVYWKPIYNLLELAGIETLVVNAQHTKAVPGRKTDREGRGMDSRAFAARSTSGELYSQPRAEGAQGASTLP